MFVLHVKSEHKSNVKKSTTYDRLLDEFMPKKMINNKVSEIKKTFWKTTSAWSVSNRNLYYLFTIAFLKRISNLNQIPKKTQLKAAIKWYEKTIFKFSSAI